MGIKPLQEGQSSGARTAWGRLWPTTTWWWTGCRTEDAPVGHDRVQTAGSFQRCSDERPGDLWSVVFGFVFPSRDATKVHGEDTTTFGSCV